MGIDIVCEDVIKFANGYNGKLFHALFCDAPYELGFMGKDWDRSGIAFKKETWEAFFPLLYPGAFGMSYASARGHHRMAVAIEDAGFVIHPSIFGWVKGQGFPKATRIDNQIDKEAGETQKKVGIKKYPTTPNGRSNINKTGYGAGNSDGSTVSNFVTEPVTELAKAWKGHRYGLQALKPVLEPLIVFQKPYDGKPIDCITQTGAGALDIDGARIGDYKIISNRWTDDAHPFGNGAGNEYETVYNNGRWPANFYLDEDTAKILDEQTGELKSGAINGNNTYGGVFGTGAKTDVTIDADKGGGSRFFFILQQEQIEEADLVLYCAKTNQKERNAGVGKNDHPTVKPISANKYFSGILLPPNIYAPRRLFNPFAGVMSEAIGAFKAGWDEIVSVELQEEYCQLGEKRIKHWCNQLKLSLD